MNSHFKNFNTSNTSFTLGEPHKGGFRVIAETTRNHIFSKEISQVMLAAILQTTGMQLCQIFLMFTFYLV